MMPSISPAADGVTSFKPHENRVSLLSGEKPEPSLRAVPSSESIRAFRKGDAELPRRICSRSVRTRISNGSLTSAVSHATHTWLFFDGSSCFPIGYE